MYAVVATGGKQYKVAKDETFEVEKLDAKAGDKVTLDQVIAVGEGTSLKVGSPMVEGATVVAEVVEQTRGPKLLVFKKKRRHNYRRKKGHRQDLTALKVLEIKESGAKKSASTEKKAESKPAAKKASTKATAEKKAPAKKTSAKKEDK